jgi:predicted nuclease of predicted toxin-antitoxin system
LRLKLDENLGEVAAKALRGAGHDVVTVHSEKLLGTDDRRLVKICSDERRCLVTLDMEFGNPILFKPTDWAGIIVLRLHSRVTPVAMEELLNTLITGLSGRSDLNGKLWVVQLGRIREYQPEQ